MGAGHPRTRVIGAVTPTRDCWGAQKLGKKHELWNIIFFPIIIITTADCVNSWLKPVGQDGVDGGPDQYARRHPTCK
jgi:hypothetical protein